MLHEQTQCKILLVVKTHLFSLFRIGCMLIQTHAWPNCVRGLVLSILHCLLSKQEGVCRCTNISLQFFGPRHHMPRDCRKSPTLLSLSEYRLENYYCSVKHRPLLVFAKLIFITLTIRLLLCCNLDWTFHALDNTMFNNKVGEFALLRYTESMTTQEKWQ